jgi:hypothetical protein
VSKLRQFIFNLYTAGFASATLRQINFTREFYMHSKIAGIAFLLLATTSLPSVAAPTDADAAKIQASLEAFFGKEANMVKVEPDGEIYKVIFDFANVIKGAKEAGMEITAPAMEFSLAPEGEGKWRVKHDSDYTVSGKMKDAVNFESTLAEFSIDAEFDEELGTFTSYTSTAKSMDLKEEIIDAGKGPANIDLHVEDLSVEADATANDAGGMDAKITEQVGAILMKESMKITGAEPVAIQISAGKGTSEYNTTGMKFKELMAFADFMGKHSDKAVLQKDQLLYKTMLQGLIPGFLNLGGTGNIEKVQVTTPMGVVNLDKVTFGLDMNGVVKDGKFQEKVGIEGLSIPAGVVPPFAATMVPKDFNFDFTVSGYDANSAAIAYITAMDLSKDPIVPKELEGQLLMMLMPSGKVDITLGKTAVSNSLYNITAEASMSAGPAALPMGKAHITAKGIDEIMKAVQAAPPEANVQQGSALIVVAKGLAKTDSDGSLSWDVESTPDGKILVNGTDVNKLK